jgi:hypothetical protein
MTHSGSPGTESKDRNSGRTERGVGVLTPMGASSGFNSANFDVDIFLIRSVLTKAARKARQEQTQRGSSKGYR